MKMIKQYRALIKEHGEAAAKQYLIASSALQSGAADDGFGAWRESYDWAEAFKYASIIRVSKGCSVHPFVMEEVLLCLHMSAGENDEAPWLAAGLLKDGRFFYLSAWCDYTGWDCQAGGDAQVAGTYADLVRYAMDEDARKRFGIVLSDDDT